jgi:predicted esterase YcpF (UPF0227 family)
MREPRPRVIYLHGFNSSPDSLKARLFADYCAVRGIDALIPVLSPDPALALAAVESLVVQQPVPALLVGSSLGGYYATSLAERFGIKAALINPAVAPFEHLDEEFLGPQRNPHTGEVFDFTLAHVDALRHMQVAQISDPARYLLLVQTGDEVLDYRHAVQFYAGCRQVVKAGGNHAFENFGAVIPQILHFARLQ